MELAVWNQRRGGGGVCDGFRTDGTGAGFGTGIGVGIMGTGTD